MNPNTMQEIDKIVHDVFLAGWNDKLLDNNHPMYKSQEQQAKAEAKQRLSNLLIEARIDEIEYLDDNYQEDSQHWERDHPGYSTAMIPMEAYNKRLAELKQQRKQLTNTEGDK